MTEGLIKRLEKSIEFIADDLTFKVGNFVLGKSKNGRILVNGYLNLLHFEIKGFFEVFV